MAADAAGAAAAFAPSEPQQQQGSMQQEGPIHHPIVARLSAASSVGCASLGHGLLRLSDESDLAGGADMQLPPDLLPDSTRSSWGGAHRQQFQQQQEQQQEQGQSSQLPSGGLVDASAPAGVRMRRSLSLNGGGFTAAVQHASRH